MKVPLDVLVRALDAIEAAYDRELDRTKPDPYVTLLKSKSELGWYVKQILAETKTEVEA